MKRGIRFTPNSGLSSSGDPPMEVCGIPVHYAADSKHAIADARGFGKRARIVVGPGFYRLDPGMQEAVLYHEAGHIIGRHREERVFMLAVFCIPALVLLPWWALTWIVLTISLYFGVEYVAQSQELDADRFAARKGYGKALLAFVRSAGPPPQVPFFYPSYERRCGALVRFLETDNGLVDEKTTRAL